MTTVAPHDSGRQLQSAQDALNDGDLDRAATLFETLIPADPRRLEPLLGLSMVRGRQGRPDDALRLAEVAVRVAPADWRAFNQLGLVLREARRPQPARAAFRKACQLEPNRPDVWFNAGALALAERELDRAARCFGRAVELDASDAEALQSLGLVTALNGDPAKGHELLQAALRLDPTSPSAWNDAGFVARDGNDLRQAEHCFRQAVACAPDYAVGWANLAALLEMWQDFDGAVAAQRECVRFEDDPASRWLLVDYLIRAGRAAEARQEMPADETPERPHALWRKMLCSLAIVYDDTAEATRARAAFETCLTALEEARAADDSWRSAIEAGFPFLLAAQCDDDRDLNGRLGRLAARTLASPGQRTESKPKHPAPKGIGAPRKIRLGIVSGAFCNHSVWKVNTKGWLDALDRDRFDLHGYRVGGWWDSQTEIAAGLLHKFEHKERKVDAWIDRIRSDRLDMLVYPEVGMATQVWQLATLRLAPVQALTFGHPVSTGLDSFDYFFSGAAMEPADGDDHYSERLIRLPDLGTVYNRAADVPGADEVGWARNALAAEGRVVYWSCQALHKYRPGDDDIYPAIAEAVPAALFAFVVPEAARTRFERRLARAFAQRGLRFEDVCRLLPSMSGQRFAAVSSCADVFLDTLGWSGMTTTHDNLAFDTPIVTTAGRFMRERHTAGILAVAGLDDWVSADKAAYVARAIRLAAPHERQLARSRLAAAKGRVFDATAFAPALNAALVEAAR